MNKSIGKVALIFEKLLQSDGPMGVNEIARELKLSNSTVSRLLLSMENYGFARKDSSSQKFFLGMKLFELGSKALEDLGLQDIAVPEMERLRDEVNESVLLVTLEDTRIIYWHKVECKQAVVINHRMGATAPAYCTASGKAMLAYMSARVEKSIAEGLKPMTPHTITDPEKLRQEFAKIRKLGYATVGEELREGVSSVGAPIFDATGTVVAAISIAVPTTRMNRKRQALLVDAVKRVAARISQQLGAVQASHPT